MGAEPEGQFAEYELPKQTTYLSYVREAWSDMGRTRRAAKPTRPEGSKAIVEQRDHSPSESRPAARKSYDAIAVERWGKIQTYAADLALGPERRDAILPEVRRKLEKLDVPAEEIDAALADASGRKLGELAET